MNYSPSKISKDTLLSSKEIEFKPLKYENYRDLEEALES